MRVMFLNRTITRDETRNYQYDSETEQQSKRWKQWLLQLDYLVENQKNGRKNPWWNTYSFTIQIHILRARCISIGNRPPYSSYLLLFKARTIAKKSTPFINEKKLTMLPTWCIEQNIILSSESS